MNSATATAADPVWGDVVGALFLIVGVLVAVAIVWAVCDGVRAYVRSQAEAESLRLLGDAFDSEPFIDVETGAITFVPRVPQQREASGQS